MKKGESRMISESTPKTLQSGRTLTAFPHILKIVERTFAAGIIKEQEQG